jgi:transaldolase/glucose-6-phosphate isomerase
VLAEKLAETLNAQRLAPALKSLVAQTLVRWQDGGLAARLWRKDPALWTGADEAHWLGWLTIAEQVRADAAALAEFAAGVRADGLRDVLLLGMGGSSLGPEVLGTCLGAANGFPRLHVLDSTDPGQVRRFTHSIDPARTLFIVSSKSGTTLEPNVMMEYFYALAADAVGRPAAGGRFVAITDPGSQLQRHAEQNGFRRVFFGVPAIGGRYSVLSSFGMVPLALTGHDVGAFLDRARAMADACGPQVPAAENPGVALGLAIGLAAHNGRDKVTFLAPPSLAAFGAWMEQLIAESTGKNGKGIIPVAGETIGASAAYGNDRLFIVMRDLSRPEPGFDRAVAALGDVPMIEIEANGPASLGQEFFRFEFATAVAGAVIGINPFDQPDVEASKVATRTMTEAFARTGTLPKDEPVLIEGPIALYADPRNVRELRAAGAASSLQSWLKAQFSRLQGGDYVAILAYLDGDGERLHMLESLRDTIRDKTRAATCLQFGPRFLHSTGQAYKGGPNTGVFIAITADAAADLSIPGRKLSFGLIEAAQARGDLQVLVERGRRIIHVHLTGDADRALTMFAAAARAAL